MGCNLSLTMLLARLFLPVNYGKIALEFLWGARAGKVGCVKCVRVCSYVEVRSDSHECIFVCVVVRESGTKVVSVSFSLSSR